MESAMHEGCGGTIRAMCDECRRAYNRAASKRYRASDAEIGGSSRKGIARRREQRSVDILAVEGRTLVRVGSHVIGAMPRSRESIAECAAALTPGYVIGDVPVIFARVPRSESPRNRDVARDRSWDDRARFGPVHECAHEGGHVPSHGHGAPPIPYKVARLIDALACTMFGHDPARVIDVSVIAECAALTVPGYVPAAIKGEAWLRSRVDHIDGVFTWEADERGIARRVRVTEGCPDCKHAEQMTTWTNTTRDERAPMPARAAVVRAERRLARERVTTPAQRKRDGAERAADLAALDARIAGYDERAGVSA